MDGLISKINFFSNKASFEEIKDSNFGALREDVQQLYFFIVFLVKIVAS